MTATEADQKARAVLTEQLQKRAEENQGQLSYHDFSDIALFTPQWGYYARQQKRVGLNKEADFYTATSLGQVFSKLTLAAIQHKIEPLTAEPFHFVEIGAEPETHLLAELAHPFTSSTTLRLGESFQFPEPAILFANELFDAQPFHRFIFKGSAWHELGVQLNPNELTEITLNHVSPAAEEFVQTLPQNMPEGYLLDISIAAEQLIETLAENTAAQAIFFFDYGKSWDELIQGTPQGTARAYYHHQQHNDLLANLGSQDLTCHVCWDRLASKLEKQGFRSVKVERQESFFMHHAVTEVQRIIEQAPSAFDPERQTLQQLLHPTHMGHQFQVLSALRT